MKWKAKKIENFNFPFRFPFNWTAPIGYFLAMAIQTLQVYCASLTYICFMVVFFGICIFLMSFVDDLENCLALNEEKILASVHAGGSSMNRVLPGLRNSLNDLVRFHTEVKQLSSFFLFPPSSEKPTDTLFFKLNKNEVNNFQFFFLSLRLASMSSSTCSGIVSALFLNNSIIWCLLLLEIHVV